MISVIAICPRARARLTDSAARRWIGMIELAMEEASVLLTWSDRPLRALQASDAVPRGSPAVKDTRETVR